MSTIKLQGAGDKTTSSEGHLTSAAAFVQGGIQDPCDDACSICLEVFCDSDPSTVCRLNIIFCLFLYDVD